MKCFLRLAAGIAALILIGRPLSGAEGEMRASKPDVRREVVAAVDAQLAAFRAGDLRKAYGYASANLRAQKPLKTFAAIVQENYPEIWANVRAESGVVRDDGAAATLLVHVFSASGDASYDYTLVKEPKGWRIATVLRHAPKRSDRI